MKAKTKKIPFETTATETAAGIWEFQTGSFCWRWKHQMGINLFVCDGTSSRGAAVFQPVVYCPTLRDAGLFAEGFVAGKNYAERHACQEEGDE